MAVEALTEPVLQAEKDRHQADETGLANKYGIPHDRYSKCKNCGNEGDMQMRCSACDEKVSTATYNRKKHLLGMIRKKCIFNEDHDVYNSIKNLSNAIEHGSADFQTIWNVPFFIYEKTAGYVRSAVFTLIGLDASSKQALQAEFEPPLPHSDPPYKESQIGDDRPWQKYELGYKPFDWAAMDDPPIPTRIAFEKNEFSVEYDFS